MQVLKNKTNKIVSNIIINEKGAVSTLVLFTLLMFVVILMGTYVLVTVNARSQLQSDERIQELIRKRCG